VNYDDETLMAYADGELDPMLSAEIAAAIERDPALARRVERHRALRAEVAGAFATVLDQPVPDRLLAAANGTAGAAPGSRPQRRADVLQFPARTTQAPPRGWGGREWGAMAASLVLGALLSWKIFAPPGNSSMSIEHGSMVARGDLARALDSQLAGTQGAGEPVQIGLTFRNATGAYCRTFTLRRAATAGLACREGGEWRIPITAEAQATGEGMRQAASLPPAVMAEVEARRAGDALDAADEEAARRGGWKPK
jgi:hypothetical protein